MFKFSYNKKLRLIEIKEAEAERIERSEYFGDVTDRTWQPIISERGRTDGF